ncbi:hypothetical protein POVWA2_026650 [Plasmodium ovale wallikeri]|uniref:Uncharacterized protein n=1 Tax=Plasmodium ovale wallikeri TaxID=864142 RepID=A0A1A8YWD9_PLAOA|nr:hypothetical protein POVWA2_026650 [Plasmodium ovale wallikeri]
MCADLAPSAFNTYETYGTYNDKIAHNTYDDRNTHSAYNNSNTHSTYTLHPPYEVRGISGVIHAAKILCTYACITGMRSIPSPFSTIPKKK